MNIKIFFKTVACAMLMPAVLLTASCSKGDDAVTNPEKPANTEAAETAVNKGYALPVTVNVTRQDNGTRATYNETTKKLEFSTGDKLFVSGSATAAGSFAGMLDYVSEGTFSGTIYTQNEYSGTADALFTAANSDRVEALLFPNGYESYGFLSLWGSGYSTSYITSLNNAIAATKAAAVEQISLETAETYSSGFALSPENAILNFTITGLTDGAKDVRLKHGGTPMFVGSVTPTSGTATFALGAGIKDLYSSPVNLKNVILTIGDTDIDITDADKYLTAGKIYNITRNAIPGALNGQFSVSSTKKVYFSKGNLQATTTNNGTSWTWAFAEHQWDYIGDAAANNAINGNGTVSANGTVDLFGWSTAETYFGIHNSEVKGDYSGDFVDWGTVPGIGEGWYTLSKDEWVYLFNTRSDAANKYGSAKISTTAGDRHGIIILPDAFVDPNKNKGSNAFVGSPTDWVTNVYTAENWALMEAAGAVFLPAAGYRQGAWVNSVGSEVYNWSSSAYDGAKAYGVLFKSDYSADRYYGQSVRLVRDAN